MLDEIRYRIEGLAYAIGDAADAARDRLAGIMGDGQAAGAVLEAGTNALAFAIGLLLAALTIARGLPLAAPCAAVRTGGVLPDIPNGSFCVLESRVPGLIELGEYVAYEADGRQYVRPAVDCSDGTITVENPENGILIEVGTDGYLGVVAFVMPFLGWLA